jgi:hypothetical protein
MPTPETDQRSALRKSKDEQIAAEPQLPAPPLPPDAAFAPVEAHFAGKFRRPSSHPIAVAGVVENGLVRPLDPAVKLPEHSRVIIVASSGT